MFKQRTITAAVLLPLVGFMVWLGDWYFAFFIILILILAGYEWVKLFRAGKYHPSYGFTIAGIAGYLLLSYLFQQQSLAIFWVVYLLLNLAQAIYQYEKQVESAPIDFLIQIGGVLYVAGLGQYFLHVRELDNGALWFFFLVTVTALGDTGAYLVGQRWGKHKMGKRVSPNKSWEGYATGVFTAMLTGFIFSLAGSGWFGLRPVGGMAFAGLLYLIIPVGDFGISLFKRWAGVKNTSNLLPGHGGILDRIDTHAWAMAIGYFVLIYLVLV